GRVRAAAADQVAAAGQGGGAGEPDPGGLAVALGEPDVGAAERRRGQPLPAQQAADPEVEQEPADYQEGGGGGWRGLASGAGDDRAQRLVLDLEAAPLAGQEAGDGAAEV